MKVTGIIAEYNPFHNGHKYQFEKIRQAGTDYIVVIMSGDFVQRGEPAIVDKYTRTKMALNNGADLVIELPTVYALENASIFAAGAVNILEKSGIVNELSFGIEKEGLDELNSFVSFLKADNKEFNQNIKANIKSGLNYPQARSNALLKYFNKNQVDKLEGSNTILGLEYILALSRLDSNMKISAIERNGNNYNDTSICSEKMSSASAIRKALVNNCDDISLSNQLPGDNFSLLSEANKIYPNDISSLLHYKLISEEDFTRYLNVKDSFSARINSFKNDFKSFDDFSLKLKSKNITYTSVRRLLMHVLLGLENDSLLADDYIRILGFKKEASPLLNELKNRASIPVINKLADAKLNDKLQADIKSANIYEALISDKYDTKFTNEYSKQIVIM